MPDTSRPLLLPQPGVWNSPEDVESFARACMDMCGLQEWALQWDHATRRLGQCCMSRRTISLSLYFVQAFFKRDPQLVRSTILHELAHALAWVHQRERTHGKAWRAWCALLGIPGEKSGCTCADFTPPHLRRRPKYALCHRLTGEVYRYYYRMPHLSAQKLSSSYIPGQKAHTLGNLCLVLLKNGSNLA